jgi:hypothetical protein
MLPQCFELRLLSVPKPPVRTHLSLGKDALISRPVQSPAMGRVVEIRGLIGKDNLRETDFLSGNEEIE